ncbi:MAG: division/cell wall cluster transcriptional repressor MraZ [Acidobacteriaceae bacterium]
MFRGNHPARVDEKGRLKLPADFKGELEGGGEGKQVFYITSKDGKRAEVWPLKAWAGVEAKLALIPNMNPAKQKFLDVTSYYGQTVEMDSQGRLLLPQLLRESAQVVADVVVFGRQEYLQVANREMFEAELMAAPLTAEDQAALAGLGL